VNQPPVKKARHFKYRVEGYEKNLEKEEVGKNKL